MKLNMFMKKISTVLAAVVLAAGASRSLAEDVVHLKNGTTVTGDIQRELDGSVWIKTKVAGIEQVQFYLADAIESIDRDTPDKAEPAVADVKQSNTPVKTSARHAGVPRAAVISLEGEVGIQMTAKTLHDIIPTLEEEVGDDGTGVVVLKVNSGGGLLLEIQKLSDVIQNEYKPRFRTVGWIESAISAAAMSSHCLEELYFLPEGSYGACVGWHGQLVAVKGRDLEEVVYMMEKISARGGHDPKIMRSMQLNEPLSCTIDPKTGEVTWYQNEDGEYLVNSGDYILTFTAPQAVKYHFAQGIAANLDELTHEMGYQELDWVGEDRDGFIYPISKAEDQMLQYREKVTQDQERTNEYLTDYMQARSAAESAPADLKPRFVGRARQHLKRIASMVRNNPNFALLNWNMELKDWERDWLQVEEDFLSSLLK